VAAAVAATMLTSACGGGKSAAAKAAAPVTGGSTLTTDQLKAALLAASDVAGYTSDPSDDTATVTTTQTVVSVGGPACQKFMDASDSLVSAYGTTAQVDRQFTNTDGVVLHVTLAAYPSAAKAQADIDDLNSGVANCKSAATQDDSTDKTTLTLTAGPAVGAVAGGDSVSAYTVHAKQSDFDVTLVVESVRVGAEVVSVGLGGQGDVSKEQKDLRDVAAREVAKVRAAQGS
jgi:hypothetical protein